MSEISAWRPSDCCTIVRSSCTPAFVNDEHDCAVAGNATGSGAQRTSRLVSRIVIEPVTGSVVSELCSARKLRPFEAPGKRFAAWPARNAFWRSISTPARPAVFVSMKPAQLKTDCEIEPVLERIPADESPHDAVD